MTNIVIENDGPNDVSRLYSDGVVIRERIVLRAEYSAEGPWGVYDTRCMSCMKESISTASVQDERLDLWWCPDCETWSVEWRPR